MAQKRLLALVGAFAIIATACGGGQATSAPASPGESTQPSESAAASGNLAAEQILRTDIQGEPPTLDPNKAQDSNSITVLYGLHRPLAYIDKDLNLVPALAESWDISDDAKTITFHLRDAKYSNGDPIVADDLVYSWKRLVDPRTAAPYSYVMAELEGGSELLELAGADPMPADAEIDGLLDKLGVSAPDDRTFVVKLATPATYFVSVATLWVTVPIQEKWITAQNATEAANYVSSGPFILDTWDHNSEIVLKPNPNWYGDVKPTLTEIHMAMSPEPAQAMAAYEAGEIDTFLPVPTEDVERVKADPNLNPGYSEVPGLSITYYTYNNGNDATGKKKLARCEDPKACPTANKNFRIALTQAIDKQAFIDATFNGLGPVANSFVMPGLPGYDESINPYPFDLEAAKASMDKALGELGFASAADIPTLKFGFNSGAGHEPRVAFLAQAWQDAFGLKTEQIGSEFGVFLTQRTAGEYDLARDGWGADYPHANNQLAGLFTCGGGNNDSQYCNPAFDALITQAAEEQDPA
ncbi:MAG TPA: peptide ABC transporter substrate-binding protein, partial [Candidatus Limnocylindrales bacterium]|nr:peptide ABC transporter substrate-binding protein [Candidatus Limnocylindrales bacterium]